MMSSRMNPSRGFRVVLLASTLVVAGVSTVVSVPSASAISTQLQWKTVANFSDIPPGGAASANFNSFNQPSVNDAGLVVFRARTKAAQGGQPVRGIYTRSMASSNQPISTVAEVGDTVPAPNNTAATFNELPSFPRIDATSSNVATRGQSSPVMSVTLPDLTTTKTGTSGVYVTTGASLETGVSLLGNVPGYEIYSVPGAPAGTKFDQFPGASSITGDTLVFKGNYTIGTSTGLTGDFYRDLSSPTNAVQLIADSSTTIPGTSVTFGSTAPPSAAAGQAVFTGWDNEDNPTVGGIYLADLTPNPALTTVASIGEAVPGQGGATFSNFGEGLSFDGRYVGFWGSWGGVTSGPTLTCPTDGNADLIAYCLAHDNGYTPLVPVHQGVFVYDTTTDTLTTVATDDSRFSSFQYWVYSGAPPGVGSGDATMEPPRWRVSAFVAVSGLSGTSGYQVAFKATTTDGVDGIYVGQGPTSPRLLAAVRTGDAGSGVGFDSTAPTGEVVTSLGLERDGLRNGHLAINAAMLDPTTAAGWGGVYVTSLPNALAVEDQSIAFDPLVGAYPGDTQPLTAISSSGYPVTYSVDPSSGAGVCSVSGSAVTFNLLGTCVVAADVAGDASYNAGHNTLAIDVTKRPQVITFTAPSVVYLGFNYTLGATSSAGLPVSYTLDTAASSPDACTLVGNVVTFTSLGACVINADQAGSDIVEAAPTASVTMNVVARPPVVIPPSVTPPSVTNPALLPQVITVPPAPVASVGGTYVLSATTDSGLGVVYEVDATSTNGVCSLSGATLSFQGVGTCVINISQPGDGTHAAATTQMRIKVGAMTSSVVVTPGSKSLRYAQTLRVNARASFAVGTATGKVQFRLDGRRLGSPVTVVKGVALSPSLLSATGHPLWPGTHTVSAVFTPSDPVRYRTATASVKYYVKQVATTLRVVVRSDVLTATVSPGGAKASGVVTFHLAGKVLGRVLAHNGVATLRAVLKPSQAAQVSASYAGNMFMVGSIATRASYQP